tara:strand:- start:50 stop:1000 length:951 start_codon:yes stop_codon:yes gene_type:complete
MESDAPTASLESDDTTASFSSLPTDTLRTVCAWLPARDVARLGRACRAALQCGDKAFCSERAVASGLAASASLEVIAIHEWLAESLVSPEDETVMTVQIGFEFGGWLLDGEGGEESGVLDSRRRIRAVAEALQMHPSATAVIDAHLGPTAPSGVSKSYSAMRGATVAAVLVWQHNIDCHRLAVRAWGKRLTRRAMRSEHPNGDAARAGYGWAEVFVELGDVELPRRPDYYEGASDKCICELRGAELAPRVSEAAAALRGRLAGTTGRGVAAARLPSPGVAGDESSSDEESSDDEDDEDDEETTTDESSGEEMVEDD